MPDADWGQLTGSTRKPQEGYEDTAKSQLAAFPAVNNGEGLIFNRTKHVIVGFSFFSCSALRSFFRVAI